MPVRRVLKACARPAVRGATASIRSRCRIAAGLRQPPLPDARVQQFQAAGDAGEEVVEVVRETAGELAHRLHLLALAQAFLGRGEDGGLLVLGRGVAPARVDLPVLE